MIEFKDTLDAPRLTEMTLKRKLGEKVTYCGAVKLIITKGEEVLKVWKIISSLQIVPSKLRGVLPKKLAMKSVK